MPCKEPPPQRQRRRRQYGAGAGGTGGSQGARCGWPRAAHLACGMLEGTGGRQTAPQLRFAVSEGCRAHAMRGGLGRMSSAQSMETP